MTIGSPIAISEPNVSSSTTIAASRPDRGGQPEAGLLGRLDRLAAELDLQPRPAGGAGDLHDAFGGALGQEVGFLVEHDGRERDLAVGRDRLAGRWRPRRG